MPKKPDLPSLVRRADDAAAALKSAERIHDAAERVAAKARLERYDAQNALRKAALKVVRASPSMQDIVRRAASGFTVTRSTPPAVKRDVATLERYCLIYNIGQGKARKYIVTMQLDQLVYALKLTPIKKS